MREVYEAKVVYGMIEKPNPKRPDKPKKIFFKNGIRVEFRTDGDIGNGEEIRLRKDSDKFGDHITHGVMHGLKVWFKLKKGNITGVTVTYQPTVRLAWGEVETDKGLPVCTPGKRHDSDRMMRGSMTVEEFQREYKGLAEAAFEAAIMALAEDAAA